MTEKSHIDNYIDECNAIFITDEISSESAVKCQIQIKSLIKRFDDNCVPEEDRVITFYITDCPGGSVSAGLAIYAAMICEKAKMRVVCSGMVASMGVIIALGGDKNLRIALPHTEFLLHQPLGGAAGQASDIERHAQHIVHTRKKLYTIISERTGQPIDKIASDSDRDFILSAEEALEYGIIDKIIEPRRV